MAHNSLALRVYLDPPGTRMLVVVWKSMNKQVFQ